MNSDIQDTSKSGLTRREFVSTAAAAGLIMTLPSASWAQDEPKNVDDLNVAIIGPGSQGRLLMTMSLKIPGLRYVAVCDVWPYHQKYARNILKKYDHDATVYEDYRQMLDKEKDLDAVIVATPDWMHAEHAIACLKAGVHVYCEKEMSNSLEKSREMVIAARETGKLLQIGHQRRSSPRYWHAMNMIHKDKLLGRITHTYGQWNRAQLLELGWPKKHTMDAATLKRFGYESMDQFRNWRWYRQYSGGPMADLGSHQIDIFNWFLKAPPKSVLASGGLDFYTEQEGRNWYDNVMSIYEYQTEAGPVRSFYQVLNTTSHGGFYEQFMGNEGSLVISDDGKTGFVLREVASKRREWEDESETVEQMGRDAIELKIGETLKGEGAEAQREAMAAEASKDTRLLHLENFFSAIRDGAKLNCPPEVAYETAVSVLHANDAVDSGGRYDFKPDEFTV